MKVLYQIGQRQLRTDRGAPVLEPRLHAVSARDVWRQAPEALFADLPRDLPYYVTFDVDCMSAVECPETGTPVVVFPVCQDTSARGNWVC